MQDYTFTDEQIKLLNMAIDEISVEDLQQFYYLNQNFSSVVENTLLNIEESIQSHSEQKPEPVPAKI